MKLPESQLPGEDMARARIKREGGWRGRGEEKGKMGEIRGGGKRGKMFILSCLVNRQNIILSLKFSENVSF